MGETVTILSRPDNGDMSALTALADAVSVSVKEGSTAVADERQAEKRSGSARAVTMSMGATKYPRTIVDKSGSMDYNSIHVFELFYRAG